MISTIFASTLIFLLIKQCTAGCDSACQKECIEVINKYRLNHHAKKVKFSHFLANKAQNWADGGRFGYDMKFRGKYGQLIEWDVKDELQNFTTVIKHWHDKERDFDFGSGRSKTGKTLHDFTQIVWKKARKAGCGQSEIFGSKYYVVWMDSDGVVSPNTETSAASIGSPEKEDLHWFEPARESPKSKSTYVVPLKAQDEDSSARTHVEPLAPVALSTGKTRSEQSKPNSFPDLNEVREEQRVLNNNALLKQYLYNDSLNNVVLDENKETASYHVVSGAEENANWQKGAETLIQLGRDKVNTNQTSRNNAVSSYPVGDEDEEDRKDATRFQSQVIQDDDMLTKDEADDHATLPSEANDDEELGEGDEREQAANIQSLMKQEDDMIRNQEEEEDEESSGSNMSEGAPSATSKGSSTGLSNDITRNSSQFFANSNQSLATSTNTGKQQREKSNSFYATGIALSNNPNETRKLITINVSSDDISSSSLPANGMLNQSSLNIHQGIDEQKADKPTGVTEKSANSHVSSQNEQTAYQTITIQQLDSTGIVPATDLSNTSLHDGMEGKNPNSSPAALSSQNGAKASQQQIDKTPMISNSQSRLTLTGMIMPGAPVTAQWKNPQVSQLEAAKVHQQQSESQALNQLPTNATSGSLKHEDSTLGTTITASDSATADVHHVSSPALITLPSTSNHPIKLVFHVSDMKSKGMSSNALVPGSEAAAGYQSTQALTNDMTNKMNDEECHDDTLQCPLWAHHGHCKGIAYAEFMKRRCKATCGYCGLPSVIKQSANHKQTHLLLQDVPCEDVPSYEFSCPRWQAQGYCEKREKEMQVVCRKTCGFCVPGTRRVKTRYPATLQPSPTTSHAGPESDDKSNSEVQVPVLSKPFTSTLPFKLNNPAKFNPTLDVQTLNISPLKPKVSLLQNFHMLPTSSNVKVFKPFGGSVVNPNADLGVKNATKATGLSAQTFDGERPRDSNVSLPSKNQDENQGVASSKNLNNTVLKSSASTMIQNNKTALPERTGIKALSFQGVTNNINNFIKAPIKNGVTSLSASNPQLARYSNNEKVANQKSGSEEDKMIQDGITALQHRLQAPLQISAVAKSSAGCKERLCKEKVKTQQAKTREIISNQDVSSDSIAAEKPVSTTGCDTSCQRECLAAHNRYRLNHGASPLLLDQKLADQAQRWADKKVFKHSPWAGGQGGETIALGSLYPTFTAAVKAWHDEERDYDWSTGTGNGGMKVNHFTQVVWKGAHLLGCGKTFINGEPYYIAQMDTPGVIADVPGFDKSNVGEPKEPDLMWFMDSSPYWKEMQTKNFIPKNIEHRIL